MRNTTRNLGFAEVPRQTCTDTKCPFHGKLSVRGRQLTGTVISTKMRKTVLIEFERLHFVPKYERYEKKRTKLKAHNPECINVQEGDIVKIMECRPLSKTKNFVVIQKSGREKGFKEKMEAREASKVAEKEKEQPLTEQAKEE